MRLLFITNGYPPHHLGGYEELCDEAARGLRKRGHSVEILTTRTRRSTDESHVHRLLHPVVGRGSVRANLGFFVGRRRREQENLRTLASLTTQIRPDIVLIWGMWNLHLSLARAAEQSRAYTTIYYLADFWPTLPDSYVLHWQESSRSTHTVWLKRLVGGIALRWLHSESATVALAFEHTMCVSAALQQGLVHAGVPIHNATIVHNAIDIRSFTLARVARVMPRSPIRILYAGRLASDKGVDILIPALGILRDRGQPAHLTILGGGTPDYVARLRQQAIAFKVSDYISMVGRVSRDGVPKWMAQCDVLVVPSIGPDSLPRVVQEAMAMGLVVLATPVGGIPEIVQDNVTGLMFPIGDSVALADRIESLADDPELCVRLSTAGRQIVERVFSFGRMMDEFETFFNERCLPTPRV